MQSLKSRLFIFCISILSFQLFGQKNENNFTLLLKSNNVSSSLKMNSFSKSNNAYNFMAIGYFLNANNNMYLKTSDKSFLDYNYSIIATILIDENSNNYKNNNWKMNVPKNNQNFSVNGKEHLISEGYFFRYVGEFLDIISKNNLYKNDQSKICHGLIYSFKKWKDRSFDKYGDYSLLFHQRIHTGANWAIVALYLNKYDSKNSNDYMSFIKQFDNQLHKALTLKEENGIKYYIWNSTYPDKFCLALKNRENYKPIKQDVSHGNHVVLYLLKANELKNKNWSNFNFNYLSNTLKLKILKSNSISDNVDGTTSNDLKNTGWKLSDGWLKLIYKDKSLEPLFKKSLKNYQSKIQNSSLELQFNSIYL